jgi:hypothetical protein
LTFPQATSAAGKALMLAIHLAVWTSSSIITATEYKYSAQVLEVALQSANFVSHPSVTTLQALVWYS